MKGAAMARTKKLNNITFIDTSPEVKKTLEGLSKTALRASGKAIRKYLRENIPTRSKRLKNHIGSWVMINRKTGQPTMQIGFYSWQKVKKKGKLPSHANPHWIEFGTSPIGGKKKSRELIKPKNSLLLVDKSTSTIYGKRVVHPGTGATHVLRDTVQNNIAEIRKAQAEYLTEISKTLEEAGIKIDVGDEFEDDD